MERTSNNYINFLQKENILAKSFADRKSRNSKPSTNFCDKNISLPVLFTCWKIRKEIYQYDASVDLVLHPTRSKFFQIRKN